LMGKSDLPGAIVELKKQLRRSKNTPVPTQTWARRRPKWRPGRSSQGISESAGARTKRSNSTHELRGGATRERRRHGRAGAPATWSKPGRTTLTCNTSSDRHSVKVAIFPAQLRPWTRAVQINPELQAGYYGLVQPEAAERRQPQTATCTTRVRLTIHIER
jgi:hypothetical protein